MNKYDKINIGYLLESIESRTCDDWDVRVGPLAYRRDLQKSFNRWWYEVESGDEDDGEDIYMSRYFLAQYFSYLLLEDLNDA